MGGHERVRFIGNTVLGCDVSLSELMSHYHAVLCTYGAAQAMLDILTRIVTPFFENILQIFTKIKHFNIKLNVKPNLTKKGIFPKFWVTIFRKLDGVKRQFEIVVRIFTDEVRRGN